MGSQFACHLIESCVMKQIVLIPWKFLIRLQRLTLSLSTGMSQAVIPSLVKMGVSGVTVGVNPMTSPPAVPSLFVWKYKSDSVIAAWHPGNVFVLHIWHV
jgi:hypothetical protein